MTEVRPLRELLADLVGAADTHADGPAAYLAAHGHDLPPDLMAEAVVSFADTAAPEVAEHLAPFVTAHTTGVEPESDWFDLLTTTPAPDDPVPWSADLDPDPDPDVDAGLNFDFGAGDVDVLDMFPSADAPSPSDVETDWSTEPSTPDAEPATSEESEDSDDFPEGEPDDDVDD
jgi:hypothetical protein